MVKTSPEAKDDFSDQLARALVELADTLVHEFDVVGFLQTLSTRCVELLDLASAGVMLHDQHNRLQVIASSDERGRTLELMELQNDQGPCLDAYRLREPVQAGAHEAAARWPEFTRHAEQAGYHSFAAVPLRLRQQTIGAMNLFGLRSTQLDERDLASAQALADIATIGLLNERTVREARSVAEQLQHALTSRVVLEQAKGVLAVTLDCTVDEAFLAMRGYARSNNRRLSELAGEVIRGEVGAADLQASRG